MKITQLTRGEGRRILYVENKGGMISECAAHIGWVTFSKSGNTVYYRDLTLSKIKGGGVSGNFVNTSTGEEFWVSGVKKNGSNTHWAESIGVHIDADAAAEYRAIVG